MSAKVAFLGRPLQANERSPRLTLNPAALIGKQSQVWVVNDGKVSLRQISTGAKLGDALEVKAGLKAGDRVVLNPPDKLKDGASVREAEK